MNASLGYGIAFGARHVAALATVALLTRTVSAELFGLYVLLRIGLSFANVLTDLGASTAQIRLVADATASLRRQLVGSYLTWRASAALVLALMTAAAVAVWAPQQLGGELIAPGVAAYATWILSDATGHSLRAFERHRRNIAGILAGMLAQLPALIWLVVLENGGLSGVLWSFAIADAVTLSVAVSGLSGCVGAPRIASAWNLLRFGAPTSVPRLVRAVAALDRHLISATLGVAHAALYQVGAQTSAAVAWFEFSVLNSAEPRSYAVGDDGAWLSRLTAGFAFVVLCVSASLTLLSRELVTIVASTRYANAFVLVGPLLIAAVQHAVGSLVNLRASRAYAPRVWAYSGGLDLVLSFSLMAAVLPLYGAEGAAWARCFGASGALCLSLALTRRQLPAALPVWRLGLGVPLLLLGAQAISLFVTGIGPRALVAASCLSALLAFTRAQRRRSKNI